MTSSDRSVISSLRRLAGINPSAESTERALENARSVLRQRSVPRSSSTQKLGRQLKIAVAVVMLAGIAILVPWLMPAWPVANIAFADVKERVNETRSVMYVETRLFDGGTRKEISRITILGRYLQRTERDDGWTYIVDAKKGRVVALNEREKLFKALESQVTLSPKGRVVGEEKFKPALEVDFYDRMRKVPTEEAKRLPERRIDGKKVIGFFVEEKHGKDTWKRTFWVDPKTKLPVRIEISHRSTDSRIGASDWIVTDFVFDADVQPSLFSTEPPPGYRAETKKVYGIAP